MPRSATPPRGAVFHRFLTNAIVVIFALFVSASLSIAQAQQTADGLSGVEADLSSAIERHVSTLGSIPSRVIGTPGYEASTDYVARAIAALGDKVEWREHRFPIMVPVTDRATLTDAQGQVTEVHPFYPASVRVNSTPLDGLAGEVVYVGKARLADIPAGALAGRIAAVDAGSTDWINAAYFGAKAILVLGTSEVTHTDLRSHDLFMPVYLPRFYVSDAALVERIRAGTLGAVRLDSRVNWQRREARNYYVLIAPASGFPPAGQPGAAALMITAPIDAMGLVYDRAPGASQAVQTAAGIELMRQFAARPANRPVIVAFLSGDGIQHRGTREMLLALADPTSQWRREAQEIEAEIAVETLQLERLAVLVDAPESIDPESSGDRALADRVGKIIELDQSLDQDRLFRLRLIPADRLTESDRAEIARLDERYVLLNKVRYSMTDSRVVKDLAEGQAREIAIYYLRRAVERLGGLRDPTPDSTESERQGLIRRNQERLDLLRQRLSLYEWLATRMGRPQDLDGRSSSGRLIDLLVGLDLSDRGSRVGPLYWGHFIRSNAINSISPLWDWSSRMESALRDGKPEATWLTEVSDVLDFEPFSGIRSQRTYAAAPLALPSELAQPWGVPGFTLATLDDLRLHRDTPADTPDKIDSARIARQLTAVGRFLEVAWNDPAFRPPAELLQRRQSVPGQVLGLSPGRPVPDLPRSGFLATYFYVTSVGSPVKIPLATYDYTLGVRRTEVSDTDAEGRYLFEGLSRTGESRFTRLAIQVYKPGPDGSIIAASDSGKQRGDVKPSVDLSASFPPVRSVAFNCREVTLTGLFDPRFMQGLSDLTLLDARRNADPQRFSYLLADQMLAAFLEPGARSYMVFRYGRVGNRLLLVNMQQDDLPSGAPVGGDAAIGAAQGFTVDELRNLGPLSLVTAADFFRLNDLRLDAYRSAGVSSSLLDSLQDLTRTQIEAAAVSSPGETAADMTRTAAGAWANQTRVYSAAQDMANDVVRAAIFLLLLCVPFSFCMERLLIGSPNIYRQIGGMVVIFMLMMAALWSFHPAFKISSSPLIIVLAFAIIFMSVVVINVVYSRFDTELKKIRSGRGSAEGASFARASVLMSAVLLGIANMRKRKFRTMLTATTIVLITFAVLCFTSSSKLLDTTTLATGVSSEYSGLMLRQRGFRPVPDQALDQLRAAAGSATLVARYWNVNAAEPKDQYHLYKLNPGAEPTVVAVSALLGLSPEEPKVSRIAEVLGEAATARLASGERDIVFLPRSAAEVLGVSVGQRIRMGGIDVEVAAVYDPERFDQQVVTLAGEPITPLRYRRDAMDASGQRLADTGDASLSLDASSTAAELASTYEHMGSAEIAIVPAALARMFNDCSLRTIAVPLKDQEQVRALSDDLAKRFAVALFAGYDDGVRMVAAGNLSSVSGAGQVAVPLAIAGLIIFNTMMGSIAERKREIHVYTSLGLAPVHVGALFVAEALTYGLIGAVFGYVIGQGVGTALLHLGWLGNVTLNYSGTSAMLTLGLILTVVLLSALVPARLASKIAAPSIDRSWKVPLPKDGQIIAELPFTINRTAAQGVLAYLAEYFDAHKEGSIGKFSAGNVEAFTIPDESGRFSRGLQTVIWLTPFDLGVRQHLMLLIHPGKFEDIYEVQVVLQRLSGDDASWYRMNRSFLTELRKQFLQWRSLAPARMVEYVEQSKALFDNPTRQEVVTTAPGEAVRLS